MEIRSSNRSVSQKKEHISLSYYSKDKEPILYLISTLLHKITISNGQQALFCMSQTSWNIKHKTCLCLHMDNNSAHSLTLPLRPVMTHRRKWRKGPRADHRLITKTLHGLRWHFVQTFMPPRGWRVLTSVILWLSPLVPPAAQSFHKVSREMSSHLRDGLAQTLYICSLYMGLREWTLLTFVIF